MTIKAVLFDMGYTLIKYDSAPEEIFRRALDYMGFSQSIEEIKKAFSETEREFRSLHLKYLFGKIPSKEYWIRWNSAILKHLKLPHNETLGKQIQDKWFDYFKWDSYPGAEETLKRLKQMRMKTGLVTTAYEDEINLILKGARLSKQYFDVIVGADTINEVKPSPNVFRYALEKLEVKPEEALFVGDSIDADYKPSEDMGMKAVLVKRRGRSSKNQSISSIRRLQEIFRFIDRDSEQ